LNLKDACLLLIYHQVGLMQLLRDRNLEEFKNNVVGLAKMAKKFGRPVILSTSGD
jgi:nicotinamidase-related amidase